MDQKLYEENANWYEESGNTIKGLQMLIFAARTENIVEDLEAILDGAVA